MSNLNLSYLKVALSPCPNDVFIVSGLLLKVIELPVRLEFRFEDIETLNELILTQQAHLIKASFALWDRVYREYEVFPVGTALGLGVGPLLVGIKPLSIEEINNLTVAIPGKHTTANFLFDLFCKKNLPKAKVKKIFVRYDEIIPLLMEKRVTLGVLIHEGRFIYEKYRLCKIQDLGEFWERELGTPLPLGGFFVDKTLSEDLKSILAGAFKKSLLWANRNWKRVLPLLRHYAREMDEETIKAHVKTYVTNYTLSLDNEALRALETFKSLLKINRDLKELIWGV